MTSLATPGAVPLVNPAAEGSAALAPPLRIGYGVSLTDLSAFNQSLASASGRLEANAITRPGEAVQALFKPLEQLNHEASLMSAQAKAAVDSGTQMTPGEMVMFTVRAHEFLFHSQLTANVANRTSDGLQQLFRQQS
jgi:hypothetical protein